MNRWAAPPKDTGCTRMLRVLLGCLLLAPGIATRGNTARDVKPEAIEPAVASRAPLSAARLKLVTFENSPFPWRGHDGGDSHSAYWTSPVYGDRRSLLYLPQGFDIARPALIVVFFHGHRTELLRDVRDRQQVPRQLAESGLNAALVAPQFAHDASDSSAGRFWDKDGFAKYLDEAAGHLAALSGGRHDRAFFSRAPVVFVAYSGGYQAATYAAEIGGIDQRLRGMILLDAPYGEEDILVDWLTRRHVDSFFVSAYGQAPRENNMLLKRLLSAHGASFHHSLPAHLTPGTIVFLDAGDNTIHDDFVTHAWIDFPLRRLLGLIPGFARGR